MSFSCQVCLTEIIDFNTVAADKHLQAAPAVILTQTLSEHDSQ